MSQQPKTITCPSCGNVNPFVADECIKCGLALGPIRDAMASSGATRPPETVATPPQPEEPAPSLPQLQSRPTRQDIGQYVDSWRFLIRGMGDRAEEIAARFFKQLEQRSIEGLTLSIGKLIIDLEDGRQDSRDYYFAERNLGEDAKAIMAVRIAPTGTDLFLEWRHYNLPPLRERKFNWFIGCFLALFYVVPALIYYAWVKSGKDRASTLEGFQSQDSTAFQLAVRAALEEAIDLAGISKALIQELPKDEGKERRLI